MSETPEPIKIDLQQVVRNRLPRHSRFIPRWVVRQLEKVICQDEMNEMLRVTAGLRDAEFCRGVLKHLDIKYTVEGAANLDPEHRRVILVSNHPLGGLDGLMLIDYITSVYGPGLRFIVNDLLMAIEPLSGVFLPINKHGRQSRRSLQEINEAMESDQPIIIFPAGLVSRKGDAGDIADLQWQKTFVNKAIAYKRDVIPVFFSGQNSKFFYNFARMRTRMGLKFNFEMTRLPKELFRARGSEFSIHVGRPIPWSLLEGADLAQATADRIRAEVYALAPHTPLTTIQKATKKSL